MSAWYKESTINIVKKLESDIYTGLSEEKVEINREKFGENKILKLNSPKITDLLLKQIKQLCIISIIIASVLLIYLHNYLWAGIILSVLIGNFFIYMYLEYSEIEKLKSVEDLNSSYISIIRNGVTMSVNSTELVVGDIVYLEKNRHIPADLRIIECENLKINELAVTGENYEVEKFSAKIDRVLYSISEMNNMAFKSTIVTEGTGMGIIVEVGMNTEIGKITRILNKNKVKKHNLLEKMQKVMNQISLMTVVVAILVSFIDFVLKYSISQWLNSVLSIILIGIPFQSGIVVFFYLYFFTKLLNDEGICFKNLSSIEQLSNTSLLLFDKSNILSKNEMIVSKIYSDNYLYNIIDGKEIIKINEDTDKNEHNIYINSNRNLLRLIQICLLCNDADYSKIDNYEKGDISEIALIKFGEKNSFSKNRLNSEFKRIFEIPFESDKKIKTTVNMVDDKYRANVIGYVDTLLERCTYILRNGVEIEITSEDIKNIKKSVYKMSRNALNSMAVAYRNFNYQPSSDENIESNLVFVGIVGMINPLRFKAYDALKFCKNNNIRTIISMDENKIASLAIGKELDLISNNKNVLSGFEMEYMDEQEFRKNIKDRNVYSMLNTKEKVRIVNHMKEMGYTITSFGHKLTQLPYLKISNLSVAVGEKSSRTVKKLSDIYMEKVDIIRFLNLFKECKQIVQSVLNIISYIITCSSAGIGLILLSLIFKQSMPLHISNIFWICMITILINCISIAINFKNINYNTLSINKSSLFNKIDINKYVMEGLAIAVCAFVGFLYENKFNDSGQNAAFAILGISESLFAFNFSDGKILFKKLISNLLVILNILLLGLMLSLPYKINFFQVERININIWAVIIACSFISFIITLLYKKRNK